MAIELENISEPIEGEGPKKKSTSKTAAPKPREKIPLPDYKNPESRLGYAKQFTQKYGPLMSGRGDTPLRINESPAFSSGASSKNLAIQYASPHKIDPALFYASTMEEGQSGVYPDKTGKVQWTTNKDYPVSGLWNFGLDSFNYKFKDLVKKGYLPSDFDKNFIYNDRPGYDEGAVFKTTDAAIQASAAMLRTHYDDVDEYVKKNNINLSPKARDFFSLASFNAGEGVGRQMIKEYNRSGYLKNDAFLKKRPISGAGLKESSYKQVYENVIRRIQMADALKEEGYFDPENPANPSPAPPPDAGVAEVEPFNMFEPKEFIN